MAIDPDNLLKTVAICSQINSSIFENICYNDPSNIFCWRAIGLNGARDQISPNFSQAIFRNF